MDAWPLLPPIGCPISNTQVYILNGRGLPVPIGAVGEICIAGAGVANGYLARETLTRERFIPNPFSTYPGARLHRTGDLGCWRSDGTIEYRGRNDRQVKIRGYRIEIGEIEASIARCSGVHEVAVVAREDVPGEKRLLAYVVLDEELSDIEHLRMHLRAGLPEYMVPSALVRVSALPRNANGKLDTRSLPVPGIEAFASTAHEPPCGEIEQALARIWTSLLNLERIGRGNSFFELGGNSLSAVQLILRIREAFGFELDLKAVFEHETLTSLAEHVEMIQQISELRGQVIYRSTSGPSVLAAEEVVP